VQTVFNVAGDVASFDEVGFRAALLAQFTDADEVTLTVSAASVNVDAVLVMRNLASATSAATTIESTPPVAMEGWFANVNGGAGVTIENQPSATMTQKLYVAAPSLPPPSSPPTASDEALITSASALAVAADVSFVILGAIAMVSMVAAALCSLRHRTKQAARQEQLRMAAEAKEREHAKALSEARAAVAEASELRVALESLRASPMAGREPLPLSVRMGALSPSSPPHLNPGSPAAETTRLGSTARWGAATNAASNEWQTTSHGARETVQVDLDLAQWLAKPFCSDHADATATLPPPLPPAVVLVPPAGASTHTGNAQCAGGCVLSADGPRQYSTYFV